MTALVAVCLLAGAVWADGNGQRRPCCSAARSCCNMASAAPSGCRGGSCATSGAHAGKAGAACALRAGERGLALVHLHAELAAPPAVFSTAHPLPCAPPAGGVAAARFDLPAGAAVPPETPPPLSSQVV